MRLYLSQERAYQSNQFLRKIDIRVCYSIQQAIVEQTLRSASNASGLCLSFKKTLLEGFLYSAGMASRSSPEFFLSFQRISSICLAFQIK